MHTGEGKRAKGRCIQGRGSALRGESATNEEGERNGRELKAPREREQHIAKGTGREAEEWSREGE